jgi:hypothetical protein
MRQSRYSARRMFLFMWPKSFMSKLRGSLLLLILACGFIASPAIVSAQDEEEAGRVQVETGRVFLNERLHFLLPDLQQGDTLYVEMSNVSGNLDPLLLLSTPDDFTEELVEQMEGELSARVAAGEDAVVALRDVLLANFLAGNDNFASDSTAAFQYQIPEDGTYLLLAAGALTNQTQGEYELVVGLNAPQVLQGQGRDTGDEIAFLDREASDIATAVQEVSGELTADQTVWYYTIPHVDSEDTLYAYVEATSGDLRPVLQLQDYSGRVLRQANSTGQESSASFEFPVLALTDNFRVVVAALGEDEEAASGEYRLLVGTNEPAVLTGEAEPAGRELLSGAKPVTVRVELQQITGVDQQAENYGGVYYLQMDWHDPAQAFNPDECQCRVKSFVGSGFSRLISDETVFWPTFTLFNQQNNRWTQNQGILVAANGDMRYYERFTTTLQAPDFNFRSFPFDTQQFYLHVDALYPQTLFEFDGPLELSGMGDQLGEEEWQVTEYTTEISSVPGLGEVPGSRFSFGFQMKRHLNYYIMRIFLPTLLIIIVSYFTFFLQNYSKRVDVTSANLLVFVAFNFTISGDLPRLGYLTFMDAMLAGVFVITALVVAFNVFLRRLELSGKEELAKKIDSYTLWVYPALYIIGGVGLYIYFLLPERWDSIVSSVTSLFS